MGMLVPVKNAYPFNSQFSGEFSSLLQAVVVISNKAAIEIPDIRSFLLMGLSDMLGEIGYLQVTSYGDISQIDS